MRDAAISAFATIGGIYGIFLMLTALRGPKPPRRFAVGIICLLGGAAICAYQFLHQHI